jgi:hypothetical protein
MAMDPIPLTGRSSSTFCTGKTLVINEIWCKMEKYGWKMLLGAILQISGIRAADGE